MVVDVVGGVAVCGIMREFAFLKAECVVSGGTLDGGVYGAFDSGLKTGAELSVATRSLAVPSALHEDEFGYGVHPGLADDKRSNVGLLVQGN